MTAVYQTYVNALLADATYALDENDANRIAGSALSSHLEINKRMTPTLAKYIGDNFTVVTHIEIDAVLSSGFAEQAKNCASRGLEVTTNSLYFNQAGSAWN